MAIKKICVVTGTRAEYGLLHWLMKDINASGALKLQIVATGMHLSPEFGLTYKQIEKDGFTIDHKVEMLLSSDTPVGISKSMGLAMIAFADVFGKLSPNLVLVLGDRFEIFSAVSAAMIARIPVAHIHGGETTEGAFDEALRHSITKMSHLHFTATEDYRKRVIQLGEHPERVFNVGAIGIDNIKRFNLLSLEAFELSIGLRLAKRNLLVTYHPVTLEDCTSEEQFSSILRALDERKETHIIFTKANADTDGRIVNKMIDNYVRIHSEKAVAHASLGQLRYLSALQFVDGVVGNSSSGIIEAPNFKIGTINIGDRQKGRIRAESVIDCKPEYGSICQAIAQLYNSDFQNILKTVFNPYGQGGAAAEIAKKLNEVDLNGITKKEFYNIDIEK